MRCEQHIRETGNVSAAYFVVASATCDSSQQIGQRPSGRRSTGSLPPAPAPPEHQYLTDNDLGAAYHLTSLVGILTNHYWQTRKGSDDRIHETAFGIASRQPPLLLMKL